MKGKVGFLRLLSWLVLAQPILVEAHPLHWATESVDFLGGLIHPLTSIEHVCAMFAVGFWIGRGNKGGVYYMPVVLMALMLVGGSLTFIPVEISGSQMVINLSVLMLSVALVFGMKVPSILTTLAAVNVTVLGGYVQAYDMMLDADAVSYTIGFLFSTVMLMIIGIATNRLFNRYAFGKDGHTLINAH